LVLCPYIITSCANAVDVLLEAAEVLGPVTAAPILKVLCVKCATAGLEAIGDGSGS